MQTILECGEEKERLMCELERIMKCFHYIPFRDEMLEFLQKIRIQDRIVQALGISCAMKHLTTKKETN